MGYGRCEAPRISQIEMTTMRMNLSPTTIDALMPRERTYVVSDAEIPAMQVRVYPSGARTLYLRYRSPLTHKKVRFRLARWPNVAGVTAAKVELLRQARADAFLALGQLGRGSDPHHDRRAEQSKAQADLNARRREQAEYADQQSRRKTFGQVAEETLEDPQVAALKSWPRVDGQVRYHWERSDAEVWNRPIEDLGLSDFKPRIDALLRAGKLGSARQARKHAGMVLTFGAQMDYMAGNCLASLRIKRPKNIPETARALSIDELGAAWVASMEVCEPWGTAFRLLMLTGCRKTEVLSLAWDLIGDDDGAHFVIPKEIEKMERGRRVELSELAAKQLASITRRDGARYVFENKAGDGWIIGYEKAKQAWMKRTMSLIEKHGGTGRAFRLHDLRHSLKTWAAGARIDEDVSEAMLGHKRQGISGRYNHARLIPEQREALERYAHVILTAAQRFELRPPLTQGAQEASDSSNTLAALVIPAPIDSQDCGEFTREEGDQDPSRSLDMVDCI